MTFQLNRISFVTLLAAIAALSGCISDNAGLSRNSSDRIVTLTTPNNMRAHLQHVKLASVRILVNGQPKPVPHALTHNEAAKRLGVRPEKIRGWLEKGLLKGQQVTRTKWQVDAQDLLTFARDHRELL